MIKTNPPTSFFFPEKVKKVGQLIELKILVNEK